MEPLGPFARDRSCAVAMSGGADSLALALLAGRWGRPAALVVDHGLRPDSAGEAAQAAERARGMGLAATVLTLRGLLPGAATAERARDARYAALASACRAAGLTDLLVAHHARDQAETVLMRQSRGSGPEGLAGMAAETVRDGVRLLRPLLPVPPGRLRATLRAAGLGWAEDPTNQDARYARVRARDSLADPDGDRPRTSALVEAASRHGAERAASDAGRAALLARWVSVRADGFAHARSGRLPVQALAALLRCLGGGAYPPPMAQVELLARELRPATLAGVQVLRAGRSGPGWLLVRELAAASDPIFCVPGVRWDGRYRVRTVDPHADDRLTVGALGMEDAARLRGNVASRLPSAVLRVLPAIRSGDRLVAVPHLLWPDAAACAPWQIAFEPNVPVAGAGFVSS